MLVWQEVEWNGMNYNSIQIAQQDGTEIRQIFHSQTFIQDIVLDQSNLLVYFVTNNFLGMISLKDYHQTESLPNGSRHVQKFPLFTDFSHFSILGTYILMLQYGNLGFQNLQNSNQVVAPSSKLSLTNLIQNEFRLIHAYSQPASHLVCTPEKSKICTDICLPNGYVAQFTCYCYNDNLCDEHGHHSFDNEQTESNQTLIISSGQNTLKDVQSNSILATVTSMKDEQRNKEHFISEDIWSRIEETTSNSIIVQNSTEITIQVQVSTISDISEKKNPTTFKPRDNQFTLIMKVPKIKKTIRIKNSQSKTTPNQSQEISIVSVNNLYGNINCSTSMIKPNYVQSKEQALFESNTNSEWTLLDTENKWNGKSIMTPQQIPLTRSPTTISTSIMMTNMEKWENGLSALLVQKSDNIDSKIINSISSKELSPQCTSLYL
ncbi:hypothetical protein RDWZM_008606 [Blomia tropicalis]|uniref:Uncharacterized protein n=1 Tax=Blomia tropicalis TaxID=40697 RepID=A0A9Q0RK68_BLOTA|nr:hypothetical protein RDWZM_008606 [Blomia tropicalis]